MVAADEAMSRAIAAKLVSFSKLALACDAL
jgi:hypothetical protein